MTELHQARVLIVEDLALLSMDLECMLADLGCTIAGSATGFTSGIDLARDIEIDVAVLDVDLAGQHSAPIADVLQRRGIPFVFSTGHTGSSIPERHAARPRLVKPYTTFDLRFALEKAMRAKQ